MCPSPKRVSTVVAVKEDAIKGQSSGQTCVGSIQVVRNEKPLTLLSWCMAAIGRQTVLRAGAVDALDL